MSLLDDAIADPGGRNKGCKLAQQLQLSFTEVELYEKGPNGEPPEVIEMLIAPNIDVAAKYRVLEAHGITIASQTLQEKMRLGCKCVWCQEHWWAYVTD